VIRDEEISVILVDQDDRVIGFEDKLEAHRKGLLHRAFSVFLFNDQGELLIQRRAASKYHAPLLWANTCCGHPFPGEGNLEAATRRLKEEMGLMVPLHPLTHIYYRKDLDRGMIEHEYVHAFRGIYQGEHIRPDPSEVCEYAWRMPVDIQKDVAQNPAHYGAWFTHYVEDYFDPLFAG
jgi:isopentenyl-diphosphate delta-isomerase